MNKHKCCALNSFFTRNILRHLIKDYSDDIYKSVIKRYISSPSKKTNGELISEIYSELKDNYRNEYFYKNTLLNKLLLGVHSVNTTTALTEIPIANSKADFILINGKAVVYEIKTELDNLDRLPSQINDYYKAFDHVAVVTHKDNVDKLKGILDEINKPVGILILLKDGTLRTVREPGKYSKGLNKETMFKVLRKNEFEQIIKKQVGELPKVGQFEYYSACRKQFLKIPIKESYQHLIELLKTRTRIEKEEFAKVPYELKFLSYFMKLKKKDYLKLRTFLNKQFGGV